MKKILSLLIVLAPLALRGAIPLVGIDAHGHAVEKLVPTDEYVDKMGSLLRAAHASVLPVLNEAAPSTPGTARPWKLRTFTLGIALNLSLGIGNILSLSISPAFTGVFSNSNNPNIP